MFFSFFAVLPTLCQIPTLRSGTYFVSVKFFSTSWTEECTQANYYMMTVGTNEQFDGNDVHIFPNPNNGTFKVELPKPTEEGLRLRITDLAGRRLMEKITQTGTNLQTIEVPYLPEGLYFLQLISDAKVLVVMKFVKQ